MTDKIGFYRILDDGGMELICCYKSAIQEYTVLEGTVRICPKAFSRCDALRVLVLPSTLQEFDGDCLEGTAVKEIHIPASVRTLQEAFAVPHCTIDPDNPVYFIENDVLYRRDGDKLIAYEGKAGIKSVRIKEETVEIAPCAFGGWNESLKTVVMPSSLVRIGHDAFSGQAIRNIALGESVAYIDDGAFSSCKIEEVVLPAGLTYVCRNAFSYCPVRSYTIRDNPHYVTVDGVLMTADRRTIVAYPSGRKTKEYEIPDGVEHIGETLEHAEFSVLHIPDSVRAIGPGAFNVDKIKEIYFGNGILSLSEACISEYDFVLEKCTFTLHGYHNTPLPELTEHMKRMGATISLDLVDMSEFASLSDEFEVLPEDDGVIITGFKTNQADIVIPDQIGGYPVKAVADTAFAGKTIRSFTFISPDTKIPFTAIHGVSEYHLPEGLKEIPDNAFAGEKITSITIPQSVTSIGEGAFMGSGITSITIPQSVTSIGRNSFGSPYNGSAIEEITIPGSVRVISPGMFAGCRNLKIVRFEEGVERIEEYVFEHCENLERIYIPSTLTFISEQWFRWGWEDAHKAAWVTVPGSSADQYLRAAEFNYMGNKFHLKVISAEEAAFEDGAGEYAAFEPKLTEDGEAAVIIKKKIPETESSVRIPEEICGKAVTEIRFGGAYSVSFRLEALYIPGTVRSVTGFTSSTFDGNGFRSVWVAQNNPCLISDGEALLSRDGKRLIRLFAYNLTEYTVPSGVEVIGANAFAQQEKLERVCLPDTVVEIEAEAFHQCTKLREIIGAEHVKRVAADAYNRTPYLERQSVIVLDGVLKKYATEESEVVIPEGVIAIDDDAFGTSQARQTTIRTIELPSTIRTIGKSFLSLNKLETLIIHHGVEDISEWSLSNVWGGPWGNPERPLREIRIPASVRKMNTGIFVIEKISIDPLNETYVEINGVLYSKDMTVLFRVPTAVGGPLFVVPDGVTRIESSAFSNNQSVEEVRLPASVTSIGEYAFSHCQHLARINLEGVHDIGRCAFQSCAFTAVKLTCAKTEYGTFEGCGKLKKVSLENTTEICSSAFEDCGLTSVILPDTLQTIGRKAFSGCRFKSVQVPKSVTEIGEKAFGGAENISVYDTLQSSIGEIGVYYGGGGWGSRGEPFVRHTITVLSGERDEVKLVVPMFTDGTYHMEKMLTGSWKEGAAFDMQVLDGYFTKIKDTEVKIAIALKRLQYPYELPDGFRDAYISYLNRSAKAIARQLIDSRDLDSLIVLETYGLIKKAAIDELIAYATEKKATAFVERLLACKQSQPQGEGEKGGKPRQNSGKKQSAKKEKAGADAPELSPEAEQIRKLAVKQLSAAKLADWGLQKRIPTDRVSRVRMAGTEEQAPVEAVLFVLRSYMGQLRTLPAYNYRWYRSDCEAFSISNEADEIAGKINLTDLLAIITETDEEPKGNNIRNASFMAVQGRYADSAQISRLVHLAEQLVHSKDTRDRQLSIVLRGALLLSDTIPAAQFADKCGFLASYASLHGMTESQVRMRIMANAGEGIEVSRQFDLGDTVITASLTDDLKITLFDTVKQKTIRSFPGKGANPELIDLRKKEFEAFKAELMNYIQQRSELLHSLHMSGEYIDQQTWRQGFLEHPVAVRLTQLLVWQDSTGSTFMTANGQLIRANGESCKPEGDVRVAHVLDMAADDAAAWRSWLVANNKKQLFEQVWEPVITWTKKGLDKRYSGAAITKKERNALRKALAARGVTFKYKEKSYYWTEEGWGTVSDDPDVMCLGHSTEIVYTVEGEDSICLQDLSTGEKKGSREMNAILLELDKATVSHQVTQDNDAALIESTLSTFTAAQIASLLTLAIDSKAARCTALLLEYKHARFPEFETVEEFTLDW